MKIEFVLEKHFSLAAGLRAGDTLHVCVVGFRDEMVTVTEVRENEQGIQITAERNENNAFLPFPENAA